MVDEEMPRESYSLLPEAHRERPRAKQGLSSISLVKEVTEKSTTDTSDVVMRSASKTRKQKGVHRRRRGNKKGKKLGVQAPFAAGYGRRRRRTRRRRRWVGFGRRRKVIPRKYLRHRRRSRRGRRGRRQRRVRRGRRGRRQRRVRRQTRGRRRRRGQRRKRRGRRLRRHRTGAVNKCKTWCRAQKGCRYATRRRGQRQVRRRRISCRYWCMHKGSCAKKRRRRSFVQVARSYRRRRAQVASFIEGAMPLQKKERKNTHTLLHRRRNDEKNEMETVDGKERQRG